MEKYQKEMGLEDYQIVGRTLDEILASFKNERSQKIVLTEILQLIYSDGVFHKEERESLSLIKEHFGFDPNDYESLKDWITKIKELSKS